MRFSLLALLPFATAVALAQAPPQQAVFGYADFSAQAKIDATFLAIPDAALAREHLRILTAEPHWASSPEDYKTAQYVEKKFKEAGLDTKIVPFRVWLNKPVKIEITASKGGKQLMTGPTPEHVDPTAYGGDPFQNDPRILPAFNGSAPSGDITADAVFANYGTLADFKQLKSLGIDVKGKIVLVKYGGNFRGVKAYIAQQFGAAGVLIYSDPSDDGYAKGDMYPRGPYRPESAVQRGSVQFLPIYAGDATTPGVGATEDLPDSQRVMDPAKMNQPSIPVNPLSYKDAAPILQALDGAIVPHDWQGGLPFAYHLGGTGAVSVHMHLEQDYKLRTIWDVIGTIPGTDPAQKDALVVAGNHRDAWVYGAVDPNSGTAAMLETVHGLGALLKTGWHPKRTIVIGSWDAEEEGLIGSTEWTESHAAELSKAVAYFNTDVAVSGPSFEASAVPSLKEFVRGVTRSVPSPQGGTVYDAWQREQAANPRRRGTAANPFTAPSNAPVSTDAVRVGDLGSGSDYTPFFQHFGVPATDIGSNGPYGVYHSVFDNFNWFVKFGDPTFVYEKQQAQVFGIELLHMADADVLPYDYRLYGRDVQGYVSEARARDTKWSDDDLAERKGTKTEGLRMTASFASLDSAAKRFAEAGSAVYTRQLALAEISDLPAFNAALRQAEADLLLPEGLPHRPWYKHAIADPGEYTGYAAVVLPGINEAIDAKNPSGTQMQINALAAALNRAAATLESIIRK